MKNWFLYIAYLLYFLGIGLQSGSIVHFIVNPKLYVTLYLVGVILFGIGAFLQKIENTTHTTTKELLRYIVFSSLFSIGVGLISGSIQHFSDIGLLASIYIPIGMILSSVFYFKKEKHNINKGHILILILAIITGFILHYFTGNVIPSHGHDEDEKTQIESGHND